MGLLICYFVFKMFDVDVYVVMKWLIVFILWYLYILMKIYNKFLIMDYVFFVVKCILDVDVNELLIFIDVC